MTIFIGGTGSGSAEDCIKIYGGIPGIKDWQDCIGDEFGHTFRIIAWHGNFIQQDREKADAAHNLYELIEAHSSRLKGDERIHVIGFSHGANIAVQGLAKYYRLVSWIAKPFVRARFTLTTLAMPALLEHYEDAKLLRKFEWYNVSDEFDPVQTDIAGWFPGIRGDWLCSDPRQYGFSWNVMVDRGKRGIPAHDTVPSDPLTKQALQYLHKLAQTRGNWAKYKQKV